MIEFIWNLGSFVVALGILITVHEYGHFWVARKNGVQVQRFSIGFGKAIWRKYDQYGTEFVIAMIPLGGYVKMLDSRVDEVDEATKHRTFDGKSVYQRIAIIAAGPLANFIFALFAFYVMFLIGVPSVKPIIGEITPESIAAQANLPRNGEIIAISGQRTQDWQDVNLALISAIGESELTLTVKTPDRIGNKSYQLNTQNWQFSPENESSIASLGIQPFRAKVHTELAVVAAGSPAAKAGLQVGDKLISIAGQRVDNQWQVFADNIKTYPEQNVAIEILREGKILQLEVRPESRTWQNKVIGYLGVQPVSDPYPSEYQFEQAYGPIAALTQSAKKTWQLIELSFQMIAKLITGDVSVKNLSGPISIAQGAGSSADYGLVYFLGFLALISINLGIINLLPLPVLDGGHLFYYFIELITGKPVPEKIQEIGFKFGTIALLSLMTIAIFNDLSRL
ncbi:site-2 protease. Metallo peptidase. MEROPS family M50B [Colwellia chukchiensis]|uniref:Zinc metalloprotease n=1 Tax=Colwellia chukchiensis TaxID=641665 RepID=A0A1H7K7R8_9GAMM|nr:sigma E protease regulator RseP [Colwellia chukchiensis]SEK82594.1 site-2 protease. Metallo peptidase. MEROPS family M50B [Colwellia chukchiensis]